ncbi:MAG: peroxidase family protein [Cyanobacteria bacterium J06600_6]
MNSSLINLDIYTSEPANFYSLDGTGNNLTNPDRGAVDSQLTNLSGLDYGDRLASSAGIDRPNARVISNTLGQQNQSLPSDRGLTNFSWAFGQFLDHDLVLSPEDENSVVEIPVPAGDMQLDPEGTGQVSIALDRTAFVPGTGTNSDNPAQIANQITSWIDGSNIYGSDHERNEYLRAETGGRLKVSAGNLLPLANESLENANPGRQDPNSLFAAGDVRGNENSVLVSMHTLFVREHNRLAAELAIAHSDWTDEQLYQRARQINIAQYQAIVYNEYLPTLLGNEVLTAYTGYDSTINPSIDRSFASAGFRVGHTQLSSEILRLDANGEEIEAGNLTLAASFFRSQAAVQADGIDPILRGLSASLSQNIDLKLIDDVRNLLFNFGGRPSGRDLLAINIERGRINGISDYNTVRAAYGLSKVSSFEQITDDLEVQESLEELYGDVDNIDLFIGLLAEDHVSGAAVGETFQTIIAQQFDNLRSGDRLYYENIFSESEIEAIESVTLTDIIQRHTDSPTIQDNAFSLLNEGTAVGDQLQGGLGNDSLMGGDGNDLLMGFQGNDLLTVDGGQNTLEGGLGNDTYRLTTNSTGSQISDTAGTDSLVIADAQGEITITLAVPEPGKIGLYRINHDLTIDLNSDGAINSAEDLTISNFFDGNALGSGAIEQINNLADSEIVEYFAANPRQFSSVHTFFRADFGSYFHTTSEVEKAAIIRDLPQFDYQGAAFSSMFDVITGAPVEEAKAVHRFLNRQTGAHLYTIDETEKNYVSDNLNNYSYEDVAYYAYDTQQENTTELYRFYNLNDDCHVYTTSISERDSMLSNESVFRAEGDDGIAFYVQSFDNSF